MKSIHPKQISYLAAICLLFILGSQAYLIYDYFRTTRADLARESDAILEESFKKDLEIRRNLFHASEIVLSPGLTSPGIKDSVTKYDFSKRTDYANNIIGLVDLAINIHISKKVPLNIQRYDSITNAILKSRGISTKFNVVLLNPTTGEILQQTRPGNISSPVFQISSNCLTIDIINNKALQLVLINPFGLIFKRMGIMLLTSFIFSIICLLLFGYLQHILTRQKQLVTFKNDFLSTIAHELKRPVASLSFNLDCLSMPAFNEDKVKHDLLVKRSVNATTELENNISMIVALAKVEEGLLKLNKEPVDLSQLFADLKNRFMSYPVKNIEIHADFGQETPTVNADEQLLTQCFANLMDNSIKYSGKEVVIAIQVQRSGKWMVITIKDNGFGIPEEKLPVIFDKYTRLEPENTRINGFGIGLNYVKTIVEKHEGEVEVQSKPGEGTEFSILLPA